MTTTISDDEKQRRHDYDQRQYRRMLQRLDGFLTGHIHVGGLVADLNTLLNVLEDEVDERWACKVSDLCNEFESIHAGDYGWIAAGLSDEEWRESREIAEKLKRLVVSKIEPLPAEE
jgi:hypothetical protein